MGFTVGAPIISLKKNYKGKSKKKGDLRKVIREMIERYGIDEDIDHSRSHLNRISGKFKSTDEAVDYYVDLLSNHEVTVKGKDGKIHKRKPRKDVSIAGNMILKPTAEDIEHLSFEEQQRLADDLVFVGTGILKEHGLEVDSVVIHNDEQGAHPHFLFHDKNFQLSKKVGLKLYGDLNREVPKYLRSRGWECDDLRNYDVEATKNMTKEEKEEYTREFRKGKKYNGLSSQEYKKKKNKEKEEELKKLQEQIELAQRQRDEEFLRDIEKLGRVQRELFDKEDELKDKDNELKDKEEKLKELKLNVDSNIKAMQSSSEKTDKSESDALLLNYFKSLKSKKYEGMSKYDEMIMDIDSQKKASGSKTWKDRSRDLKYQSDNLEQGQSEKELY